MALELRQQLKLTQQLIMTPQLQMAIKLLQLSRLELLDTIRQEVRELTASIEVSLENAVHSLLTLDRDLAYQTILGDHAINRATRAELERLDIKNRTPMAVGAIPG